MPKRNTIEIVIQGEDRASGTLDKVTGKLTSVGKLAAGAVVAGFAAAGVAAVGFGTLAVREFTQFENQMAEVFTLLPNISAEAMGKLEDDVLQVARTFGILPNEVIPATYQAISAGVPSDNILEFMKIASQAAIGGVTELETAVDGITSVVNAYGSEAIDAQRASDLMFTAVRLGKTDFTQLSSSLFNVLPTANALGIEFENVTAALATITAQGTPTSVATNQLRALFQELQKPTSEVSKLFQEISGESFPDFIKNGGDLSVALNALQIGMADSGKETAEFFGSVEALNAFLGVTGGNFESFTSNLEEMGASAGATEAAFETMSKTLQFQLNRLRANFSTLLIEVGRRIAPFVAPVIEAFNEILSVLIDLVKGVDLATGDFGRFGNAFRDALLGIRGAFDLLFRGDFTGEFGRFFGVFEDSSVINNILTIRRAIVNAFSGIGDIFSGGIDVSRFTFIDELLEPFMRLKDEVGLIFGELFEFIGNLDFSQIIDIGVTLFSLTSPLGIIKTILSDVLGLDIVGFFESVLQKIGLFLTMVNDGVEPIQALRSIIGTTFGDEALTIFDNIINAVNNFINNVFIPGFNNIKNFIQTQVMPRLNDLGNWFLTSALPAVVGFIENTVRPAIEGFITTIADIWERVRPSLERLGNWFLTDVLPQIETVINTIFLPVIQSVIDLLVSIWETVRPELENLLNWFIDSGLPLVVDFFERIIGPAIADFVLSLQSIWRIVQVPLNALKLGIQNIFNFLRTSVIQPVIDLINAIPQAIRDAKNTVDRIVGDITRAISSINLDPFAPGGLFNRGFQNGLEYVQRPMNVRVHRGEAILTAEQNEERLRSGGSNSTNNTFQIMINAPMSQEQANSTAQNFVAGLRNAGVEV